MVVCSMWTPPRFGLKRPFHRWHHDAARQEESIPSFAAVGVRRDNEVAAAETRSLGGLAASATIITS